MDKIMIIVPHEDDEILMAAGIIERAVREKKEVTVVMATNGDYEGTDTFTGGIRLSETLLGLSVIGLPSENVIFMGYADTGMENEVSFLYNLFHEKNENKIHEGHCSKETYGLKDKVDFHREICGEPGSYTRKNFKEDLRKILLMKEPDTVFTTSVEDVHGDHSGLYLFVREVLEEEKENGYQPVLYSGVAHSKAGDDNWPERNSGIVPYTCPEGFDKGSLRWEERISFPVPDSMLETDLNKNKKAIALSKHKTALKEDAVEFLYTFIKSEELFWEIKEG